MPSELILVVDVEATCWRGLPPPGEQNEIIEIGLCTLDARTCERIERDSFFVRPERSKVSPFCTELTSITQADVQDGLWFLEACDLLQSRYQSRERVWASYGEYDRKQFSSQCEQRGIPYPFGSEHINVKARFAEAYQLARTVGMAAALRRLRWPLEGTHHRAGDDAWNIAGILGHLLQLERGEARRVR